MSRKRRISTSSKDSSTLHSRQDWTKPSALGKSRQFSYSDVLQTHGILFNAVYPWAGQDRLSITPTLSMRKGPVIFANPSEIQPAVEFALRKATEKNYLRAH